LYLNNRDGAKVVWDQGDYPLTPGLVHLIPSGVQFDCRCNRKVTHFYVHFDLVGLPLPALAGVFDRPMGIKPSRVARGMFAELLGAWRPGAPMPGGLAGVARVKAATYQALAMVFDRLSPSGHEQLRRWTDGRDPISPAVRYIEDHFAEPIGNDKLARMCHLSTDHFSRRFRKFTGRSPAKYIADRRINQASQRLMLSGDSIEQIAAETGFPDRFYFSRVFKQRTLISPAAYRKWARVY
jgi:AraC-like DNA-binding protein